MPKYRIRSLNGKKLEKTEFDNMNEMLAVLNEAYISDGNMINSAPIAGQGVNISPIRPAAPYTAGGQSTAGQSTAGAPQSTAGMPQTAGGQSNVIISDSIENNYPEEPSGQETLYTKPGAVPENNYPNEPDNAPAPDNNIYPDVSENQGVSPVQAVSDGSVAPLSPLTLVSANAVTVDLAGSIKDLRHIFPSESGDSLDRIVSSMDAYLDDYKVMQNGDQPKKLSKLSSKDRAVGNNYVVEVTDIKGATVSLVPMRTEDLMVFNAEVEKLSREINDLNSRQKGIDPEEYRPGQELGIDDLARIQLANVGYQLKSIREGLSSDMTYPVSIFGNFRASNILGVSPRLTGNSGDESYTPEQGRIMMSAMPTAMLEYEANKMRDIQIAYARNRRRDGFNASAESEVKEAILRQAAKMKRLTSQCMKVAEDKELFGMGEKDGAKVFAAGTSGILGEAGTVNAMDANLDMLDAAIKNGWPVADLNALGSMAFLARSVSKLEKVTYVNLAGKRAIRDFIDFVDDLKEPKSKKLDEDTREATLEKAKLLLEALPDDAKIDEFKDIFRMASDNTEDSLKYDYDEREIGIRSFSWDNIKAEPFGEKEFEVLKKRTKAAMETASSTLQAKCLTDKAENEKSVTRIDVMKAYRKLLDKNDSMLHKDSAQFRQVKADMKKLLGKNGTEADRQKLTEDVKKWLTDPGYDRIRKHTSNSFDNKRFNDMFALANELDPVWAHEKFKDMRLSAHSGSRASESAFTDINAFLQHEHKMTVDKGCIVNSEGQKSKAWYTGKNVPQKAPASSKAGKNVKHTSLEELEKKGGNKKQDRTKSRKSPQKSVSKKGTSKTM